MADNWIFVWVVLPMLIFLARIMDVSIGTMRLIFLSKGMKFLAPLLGFFEVIIWLVAIGQIMKHLDNWISYIAYGAGFATGNYIGIVLEEKLSIGTVIIRVILPSKSDSLLERLREKNYGITIVDAQGSKGAVNILFSIIRRKEIGEFLSVVHQYNPGAFYTIENVKDARQGVFKNEKKQTVFASMGSLIKKAK